MKRFAWMMAILMLLPMLTACKTYSEKKDAQLLESRISTYGQAVRWAHMEDAHGYVKREPGDKIKLPENMENIRITEYEVFIPPYKMSDGTVIQTVRITYVHKDRQVVKSLTDEQLWEFDEERENWYRINPIPEFE